MSGYVRMTIGLLYKNSSRKNAKRRIKLLKGYNIDSVLTGRNSSLGLPVKAEILEIGIGEKCIRSLEKKVKN